MNIASPTLSRIVIRQDIYLNTVVYFQRKRINVYVEVFTAETFSPFHLPNYDFPTPRFYAKIVLLCRIQE